jgi:valyl-tRNA synthetase
MVSKQWFCKNQASAKQATAAVIKGKRKSFPKHGKQRILTG